VIAGHFGFAALVKSRAPEIPLWILMLATVWLDIVFVPLFLAGIETIEPVAGHHGYGASVIHAEYTHSIPGMLGLSLILGGACWPFLGKRSAIVVGLVSASHWALDAIVHRADLPILPANALGLPRLGLGLWAFPTASISIEALLVLAGALAYWRAARKACIAAGRSVRIADVTALLIGMFGAIVLCLDAAA